MQSEVTGIVGNNLDKKQTSNYSDVMDHMFSNDGVCLGHGTVFGCGEPLSTGPPLSSGEPECTKRPQGSKTPLPHDEQPGDFGSPVLRRGDPDGLPHGILR